MCSTLNHPLGQAPASSQLSLRKLLSGSVSNLVRVLLSVVVAITLPPLLVRHLSQAEYSAWVLILQLSAYIALLDLGLQAVISKSIAEYHAKGDHEAKHRLLSTSVADAPSMPVSWSCKRPGRSSSGSRASGTAWRD